MEVAEEDMEVEETYLQACTSSEAAVSAQNSDERTFAAQVSSPVSEQSHKTYGLNVVKCD